MNLQIIALPTMTLCLLRLQRLHHCALLQKCRTRLLQQLAISLRLRHLLYVLLFQHVVVFHLQDTVPLYSMRACVRVRMLFCMLLCMLHR